MAEKFMQFLLPNGGTRYLAVDPFRAPDLVLDAAANELTAPAAERAAPIMMSPRKHGGLRERLAAAHCGPGAAGCCEG